MGTLFVNNIKQQSSQGSGTITIGASGETVALGSGVVQSNLLTPAFKARKTSNQNAATGSNVKITFDTEDYDTDSAFADSKFTVPSGKAGKYFLNFFNRIRDGGNFSFEYSFYKNGSKEDRISNVHNYISGDSQYQSYGFSTTMDLSASDYIEVYVNHTAGGAMSLNGGTGITIFTGFRIGT